MPLYDAECSDCGFAGTEELKIAALDAWDLAALCPQCQAPDGKYRRVIRQAPMSRMGGDGSPRSEAARKLAAKQSFRKSSEKDDMLHRASKRVDHEQNAAVRESAKKGDGI